MRVIISEYESYEMKIPEEIQFADFDKLVSKLNVIVSMLKDPTSKKVSPQNASIKYTKEQAVTLMRIYNEDGYESPRLTETLRRFGTDFKRFQAIKPSWIKRFNLTPQDVGLTEWPTYNKKEEVN